MHTNCNIRISLVHFFRVQKFAISYESDDLTLIENKVGNSCDISVEDHR